MSSKATRSSVWHFRIKFYEENNKLSYNTYITLAISSFIWISKYYSKINIIVGRFISMSRHNNDIRYLFKQGIRVFF